MLMIWIGLKDSKLSLGELVVHVGWIPSMFKTNTYTNLEPLTAEQNSTDADPSASEEE